MLSADKESLKEIEFILEASKRKFLEASAVLSLLEYGAKGLLQTASKVPNQPPSGCMFLYDKAKVEGFRADGHNWVKKKGTQTAIREDHVRLKVQGELRVYACHAHSEESKTFHRRCYSDLKNKENTLVLVHYLDTASGTSSAHSDCECLYCMVEKHKRKESSQHSNIITIPSSELHDQECSDFLQGVDFDTMDEANARRIVGEFEIDDFAPSTLDTQGGSKVLITLASKNPSYPIFPSNMPLKVQVRFGKSKRIDATVLRNGVIRCFAPSMAEGKSVTLSVLVGGIRVPASQGVSMKVQFVNFAAPMVKREVSHGMPFHGAPIGFGSSGGPAPSTSSSSAPSSSSSIPAIAPSAVSCAGPANMYIGASYSGLQSSVKHLPAPPSHFHPNSYHPHIGFHPASSMHPSQQSFVQHQQHQQSPLGVHMLHQHQNGAVEGFSVIPQEKPSTPVRWSGTAVVPPPVRPLTGGSRPGSGANSPLPGPSRRLLKRKLNRHGGSSVGGGSEMMDDTDVDLLTEEELSELSESLLERVVRVLVEMTKDETDLVGEMDSLDESGFNLLHYTVAFTHEKLVDLLLEHGADPNKRTSTGDTPLHLAAETGDSSIVQRLVRAGADPTLRDADGLSCAQLANKYQFLELAEWFTKQTEHLPESFTTGRHGSFSLSSSSSSSSSSPYSSPRSSFRSLDGSGKFSPAAMLPEAPHQPVAGDDMDFLRLSPTSMDLDLLDSSSNDRRQGDDSWQPSIHDSPAKESREDKQNKMLRKALASMSLKDRCALSLGMSSSSSGVRDHGVHHGSNSVEALLRDDPDSAHQEDLRGDRSGGVKKIVSENESALQPVISAMHDDERSELEAEARIIQANFRRWMLRKNVLAARKMQTETKGFLANKEVENKVTKVQAVSKGFLARKEYQHVRQEVIHVQAATRGLLARKNFLSWRRQLSAALVIQRSVRAHQMRLKGAGPNVI